MRKKTLLILVGIIMLVGVVSGAINLNKEIEVDKEIINEGLNWSYKDINTNLYTQRCLRVADANPSCSEVLYYSDNTLEEINTIKNKYLKDIIPEISREIRNREKFSNVNEIDEVYIILKKRTTIYRCNGTSIEKECLGEPPLSSPNQDGLSTRCYKEISGWYNCFTGWILI